jgi:putative transposase
MYSREKRMKAIELYLQYNKCSAAAIHELGYPSRNLLRRWYKRYLEELKTGVVWDRYTREWFTKEQKETAVKYYLEHGKSKSQTVKMLGYPSRTILQRWCEESGLVTRKKRTNGIQYTPEQKKEVVINLCNRTGSAKDIAKEYGVTRVTLYNWKQKLLGKGEFKIMPKAEDKPVANDKETLLSEIESLQQQIRRLKLEKDLLEKAAEIVKKELGIDLESLTNKEKTKVIDALKKEYTLSELVKSLHIPRSSYFYHHKVLAKPDKYKTLQNRIHKLFIENSGRYGYRRIHTLLAREETHVSEKVVRRLMGELNLVVFGRKKRKYSSYRGEDLPAVNNLIERDFHASAPNVKWLTDLTEFHLPAGKVFLSPIIDCFDGCVTSWSIGTNPDADLVNSMLDQALTTLKEGEHPLIHTDRGCHYRWPGWISRMKEAQLARSMSKKACSPDNAACEGFFGRLKNEMFYHKSWAGISIEEFMDILEEYLVWYNEKRIKLSLGGMSPLEYRQNLGLAI